MSNLFSDDSSGYRLKTLQILNWGVFDRTVKTFEFHDKSTILTGFNGTGKTTAVDAILTLLIPSNLRWYNLSSDSVKKRERDVENYVRGAYGNGGDGVTNYLRDKSALSVLNGIFEDPSEERALSLLQVRYFSGDRLDTKYVITDRELTIGEIDRVLTKEGVSLAPDGKWRKVLVQKCSSRLFESFTAYKTYFMDKFGFRSDNALKLFSQTVGMKVLGDITGFVRSYMLEDKSPEKEFSQLDEEFSNLLIIDTDIKKDTLKLEKLEKIHTSGLEWERASERKSTAGKKCLGEYRWYVESSASAAEAEIRTKSREKKDTELKSENLKAEIAASIKKLIALGSDSSAEVLAGYDRELSELKAASRDSARRHSEYSSVFAKLSAAGSPLDEPITSDSFYALKDSIPSLIDRVSDKKERAEERKQECGFLIREINASLEKDEAELSYLSQRDTNIPQEYDELRNDLASKAGLANKGLFFLGELLTVKEQDEWTPAITKLINREALTLLVEKHDEKNLLEVLDSEKLKRDITLLVMEDAIMTAPEESTLLPYLSVREKDNPYRDFVASYIKRRFDHAMADNIDELLKQEKAILNSGVVSEGERKSRDEDNKPSYLGWDNRKRREELILKIQGQKDERNDLLLRIKDAEGKISKALRTINLLEKLGEFESWKDIDTTPYEERINDISEKRKQFLLQHKDLEEKERLRKQEEERQELLQEENNLVIGNIRELENSLKALEEQAEGFRNALSALDDESEQYRDIFLSAEPECSLLSDLRSISTTHEKLSVMLRREYEDATDAETKARSRLERHMQEFISPSVKPREEALSWNGEYPDLVAEADSLSDFEAEYVKIKEDEIVELRAKFDQYLTVSLKQSIGNLNEKLRSWNREIHDAIRILNRNLMKIPFDKIARTHLQLEMRPSGDRDHKEFDRLLMESFPDVRDIISNSEEKRVEIYKGIRTFLDRYRKDDALRSKVLDTRRKYVFSAKEVNADESTKLYYQDTGALSGGEKAKLTYTILAASIAYQFNLDDSDNLKKGPFRFVILDEAFSKSDARNSEYALQLFKELDLQLMVITPRNSINIVEGYVSSLHLLEKNEDGRTSRVSGMTIEEYRC